MAFARFIPVLAASAAVWIFLSLWEGFSCRFAGTDFFGPCAFTMAISLTIYPPIAFLALPLLYALWRFCRGHALRHGVGRPLMALGYPAVAMGIFGLFFVLARADLAAGYTGPGTWHYPALNHELWSHGWPLAFCWWAYAAFLDAVFDTRAERRGAAG